MKVSGLKNDVHCGYESNWVYDKCFMLIQSLISAKKQLDSVSNRVELGSCSFYFNKQDGRHKYALEAFMLLVQDKALLSPQMAYQLQWGRLGTSQKHSYVYSNES